MIKAIKRLLLQLPESGIKKIGYILTGGSLVFGLMISLSPIVTLIIGENNDKANLELQLAQAEEEVVRLQEIKDNDSNDKKIVEFLSLKFPSDANQQEFIAEVASSAINAGIAPEFIRGITFSNPAILPPQASGQMAEVDVSITIAAGLPISTIAKFVDDLYNLTRGISITNITSSSEGQTVISAKIFISSPAPDPANPGANIAAPVAPSRPGQENTGPVEGSTLNTDTDISNSEEGR
jgi:Tfp pilus assembly protein PilO